LKGVDTKPLIAHALGAFEREDCHEAE
jgi:hypothetical protein